GWLWPAADLRGIAAEFAQDAQTASTAARSRRSFIAIALLSLRETKYLRGRDISDRFGLRGRARPRAEGSGPPEGADGRRQVRAPVKASGSSKGPTTARAFGRVRISSAIARTSS